jgi:hypothetical protein
LALGFHGALERFEAAAPTDADAAFVPLFEMLNWATAIDDRAAEDFAPDGGGDRMPGKGWEQRLTGREVVRGIRFARNVVHHRWADAVIWCEDEWRWRASAELPPRREGRADYERELAGKPVLETLRALDSTFAQIAYLLDSSGSIAGMGRANRRAARLAPLS